MAIVFYTAALSPRSALSAEMEWNRVKKKERKRRKGKKNGAVALRVIILFSAGLARARLCFCEHFCRIVRQQAPVGVLF